MRKLRMSELNRLSTEEFKAAGKNPISIVLDNVRSTLNVGSVFRTADAFRLQKIYLCGLTPTPENREMRKTALGGTESVEWEHHKDCKILIQELKSQGKKIIAVEQTTNAIQLQELEMEQSDIVLVFGNEVMGVDQEVLSICDSAIEIPQFGTKHSLNISVSAGIVVWDFIRKWI